MRHAALWFAGVLLVALAVRVYLVSVMPIISRDGVTFIRYAQGLQTQPRTEMRRQRQHPLYPASIAVVEAALRRASVAPTDNVRRWLVAGQSVAFAASLAVIPALYWLGCLMFGRRVGVVTAACAAVLPAISHYGVDVLSDTLHLTLYVLALAAGMSGLRRRAWGRIALAGGLAALAFLTRPEGGEVLVVLCGAIVLLRAW
ncbi:MAG: glycosyltransferase family 39 protein, partial [Phycisphaerae bacterium]|nr:glycosyltransferase family 39 protein [Phycisphaerae bacterium]